MPNGLLARYFHARGQLLDLDFAAIDEAQPEPLFEVWLALPNTRGRALTPRLQARHEARAFATSCQPAVLAMLTTLKPTAGSSSSLGSSIMRLTKPIVRPSESTYAPDIRSRG